MAIADDGAARDKRHREEVDQRHEAKNAAWHRINRRNDELEEDLATPSPQALERVERSQVALADVRESTVSSKENDLAK